MNRVGLARLWGKVGMCHHVAVMHCQNNTGNTWQLHVARGSHPGMDPACASGRSGGSRAPPGSRRARTKPRLSVAADRVDSWALPAGPRRALTRPPIKLLQDIDAATEMIG